MVGGDPALDVGLEVGARNVWRRPLEQIDVIPRRVPRFFEHMRNQGFGSFQRILLGFHLTLPFWDILKAIGFSGLHLQIATISATAPRCPGSMCVVLRALLQSP